MLRTKTGNRKVIEKSDSKNHAFVKVRFNTELSNNLLSKQEQSDSLCYVCAEINPQYSGVLFDKRIVSYCGDCIILVESLMECN